MAQSYPTIKDSVTARRMEHQRLRFRLLYGLAEEDIKDRLEESIGHIRQDAWGPVDLTSNPFLTVWSQAAGTYRSEPIVMPPEGLEDVAEAVAEAGHWSMMQRVQRDALAMRENFVRLDYDEEEGLSIVPVPPFLVDPKVHPRLPHRMVAMTEWRPDPDDKTKWVRIVTDPRDGTYRAFDEDDEDVSLRVLEGDFSGNNYPFVGPDGARILPYVCYRSALTGTFWDSFTGVELVETSLQLGLLYSFYVHCVKDSSWKQKVGLGVRPVGTISDGATGRSEIVTDPSAMAFFELLPNYDGPSDIKVLDAASDPEVVLRSIQAYERRAVDAALGTANVSRSNSDIRSSFSLAISRDEQRELQRSYEPVFRRSDVELLRKAAALMGHAADSGKWRIEYKAIPKSPQETSAELDRLTKAVEAGLMSRVEAYMAMHPQLTKAEAMANLEQIALINRRLAT